MKKQDVHYRWAVGRDLDKARPVSRLDQNDPEYTLVWVPVEPLLRHTDRTQRTGLRSDKLAGAAQFWQDGGYMEPPVVSLYDGQIVFADGRHRVLAARTLGIGYVPLVVPAAEVAEVRTLLGTASGRQPLLAGT